MPENARVVYSSQRPLRVAILISGRGSNMQALVQAVNQENLPVEVCTVLSNQPDAAGLDWARSEGLPVQALSHRDFATRAEFDTALLARLDALAPDYILLAGFMRVLTPGFVRHFDRRIINIHPSLLPAFPGLHTHQQAVDHGVLWHGCTVHFVTPVLDHGPIIAQGIIPVHTDDTADTLATKLLPVEHQIYTQTLRWLAQDAIALDADGRVQLARRAHRAWLGTALFH